jgi:hypothetical protein
MPTFPKMRPRRLTCTHSIGDQTASGWFSYNKRAKTFTSDDSAIPLTSGRIKMNTCTGSQDQIKWC